MARALIRVTRIVAAVGLALASSAAAAEDWDWHFAPYVWATSIKADLGEDIPPAENQREFDEIMDKIEGAFLVHLEGQGDDFGFFADGIYLGLGDDRDYERVRTETDLDAVIAELAMVWSPGDERHRGFELFGGVRYFDVGLDVEITPNNPNIPSVEVGPDPSYVDFLAGARYTTALSDRWALTLRGDASAGESEGSWSASGVFQYRTDGGAWLFGYRYLAVELEENGESLELDLYGPEIGYAWAF